MGRAITSNKLTKQAILDKVSQVTIFSSYLNLTDIEIQNCINTGELICSPIRDDAHPTCGFKYDNKGRLKFKDFSGFFWGDCFDVVAFVMSAMYNKQYDVNNKQDFIKILRHITFTFKDIFYGQERDINLVNEINTSIAKLKTSKPNIELVVRPWNQYDKEYWNKFGISLQFLNINFIYAIDQYYINRKVNPEPKYYYDSKDPCYGYLLGQDKSGIYNIKLYFPNRDKGITRFITNCNHLEGIYNLNKNNYDIIVITKSTKDRLSIGNTILNINSFYRGVITERIGVINIPHETYRLRQNEYDWIRDKLSSKGTIVSLMDNDRTGKLEAIWLKNNFNIKPILIPERYNSKDFSEFVMNNDINIIKEEIINVINNINNLNNGENNIITWDTGTSNALPY